MANNRDQITVQVLDSRGIVEGDKFYAEGEKLKMPRARFEILSRAVKVSEVKTKTRKAK